MTKTFITLAERQHSYFCENAAADVEYSVGDSKASEAEILGMAENRSVLDFVVVLVRGSVGFSM